MPTPRFSVGSLFMTAICLIGASPAFAQDTTGDIEGRIRDGQGEPVGLATVAVSGPNRPYNRGAITDKEGYFIVPKLSPGKYTVKVSRISYRKETLEDVVVYLGRTTALQVTLVEAPISVEPVVVIGRRPLLDLSSTEVGNNLSTEVLDQLPTPRDYREVIAYVPQANISYLGDNMNIGGSTGEENQYFIEGVNVTDPFLASGGTRLPQNFVQEVQIKRGGYEAEYGKATGGIINVITHSGSNEFHGEVFGFLTNNNVASDSRRGLGEFLQRDFARYDLGASLGGPIARDKLWYFAAYNPTFETKSLQIPGLVDYHEDKTVAHLFAGKLTWSPDLSTNVDLTMFGDPTHQDKVGGGFLNEPAQTQLNADPLLSEVTTGAVTAKLSGRRLLGERAIVEASVSRVETNNEQGPATEIGRTEVNYADLTTGTRSGGMQIEYDHHTVQWAADLSTTVFAGSHELKLGLAYEDIALDEQWIVETPDGRPGKLTRIGPDLWSTITLRNDFAISHRLPSAYLQDSWRVNSRLRLNAGIRWDGTYIVNPEGEVAHSINDGYQPRAGFTLQLDNKARQKLFGSYGRFYEQIPMIASSWYFGNYYQKTDYYDVNPLPDFTTTPIPGGYVLDNSNYLHDDFDGQYLDEFALGYERLLGRAWKAGVRGVYRDVGRIIEVSVLQEELPNIVTVLGNPGEGRMSNLPTPTRIYKALEFSLENTFGGDLYLMASYVLSQTRGNYPGVFNTDGGNPHAHVSNQVILPEQISDGLLPNDRTHVFKMYGSYAFNFGLNAGAFFTWMSGTPLSEYGGTWAGPSIFTHLVPRGSAGRTPSIWDASLRLSYELASGLGQLTGTRTRLLLDVFHLFGQRKPTVIDQVHYFGGPVADPATYGPNMNYGKVVAYQPPMTVRFGVETSF